MALKTVSTLAFWTGGTATTIRVGAHEFHMDQPADQGGTDLGPTPVQYMIASLSGCMSLVGRLVAEEMGISFRSLSFSAEGDIDPDGFTGRDPGVESGVQAIRVSIEADGDGDGETLERWLETTKRRCPVAVNLMPSVSLAFTVRRKA